MVGHGQPLYIVCELCRCSCQPLEKEPDFNQPNRPHPVKKKPSDINLPRNINTYIQIRSSERRGCARKDKQMRLFADLYYTKSACLSLPLFSFPCLIRLGLPPPFSYPGFPRLSPPGPGSLPTRRSCKYGTGSGAQSLF